MNSSAFEPKERQPLSPLPTPFHTAKLAPSTYSARSAHCCCVIGRLPRAVQSSPDEIVTSRLPRGDSGAGGVGGGGKGGDVASGGGRGRGGSGGCAGLPAAQKHSAPPGQASSTVLRMNSSDPLLNERQPLSPLAPPSYAAKE